MRVTALAAALALTGCFIGSEFYEPTDDEVRQALTTCGFTGREINPPGDEVRVRFNRNVPGFEAKHECFVRYGRERDWIVLSMT